MSERQGLAARETARQLLAEATGRDASEIDDQASINNFESWDSLAHLRLILALEAETGSLIEPELVVELTSLADLTELLVVLA